VFDFGDINQPTGLRATSTVAPQALYLLNHPFVAEQARLAAEHTLALPGTDAERITAAFRKALGRAPTPAELAKCQRFLTESPSSESWAELQQTLFACLDFRYLP